MNKKYELYFGLVSGIVSIAFSIALFNLSGVFNALSSIPFIIVLILGGMLAGFLYKKFKNKGKKIESNLILGGFIFINIVLVYFSFKMMFLTSNVL